MLKTVKTLWCDDAGIIISAELVLVLTIPVLGCLVGLREVSTGLIHELADISNSFGALDQSWEYVGYVSQDLNTSKVKSRTTGGRFRDQQDECDSCSGATSLVNSQIAVCHGETIANQGGFAAF